MSRIKTYLWPTGSLVEFGSKMTGYGAGEHEYDFVDFVPGQLFMVTRHLSEDMPMYEGLIIDKDDEVGLYAFDKDELEQYGNIIQ